MKYKLTFHAPEPYLQRLKDKGAYPLKIGGLLWEEGTTHIVEKLYPFYEDCKSKKQLHVFLKAEELKETYGNSEETD